MEKCLGNVKCRCLISILLMLYFQDVETFSWIGESRCFLKKNLQLLLLPLEFKNENFKNARKDNSIKLIFTTWEHYTEKGIQKPMNKETSEIKKMMCAKNVRLAISCACAKAKYKWWCKFYYVSVLNKNVNILILYHGHVAGPLDPGIFITGP